MADFQDSAIARKIHSETILHDELKPSPGTTIADVAPVNPNRRKVSQMNTVVPPASLAGAEPVEIDEADDETAPETNSYKQLRQQYETSIARAKLEFAESGDDDKLWPGINHRQDERDEAIFDKLLERAPPCDMDDVRELLHIIVMFMEANQLGMTSEEIETAVALVKNADSGLSDIQQAERTAKWDEDDRARGIRRRPNPVRPAEKRDIEIDLEAAIDLMDCASNATRQINVTGTSGVITALTEASNKLCDVMEKLGISDEEGRAS